MNWIVLIIIALLADSLWIFNENYIADYYFKGKGYAAQKIVFGFTYIFIAILAFFILNLNFNEFSFLPILFILIAGIFNSFADLFYCRAMEIEDSTTISIFTQLAPIAYLIFGWLLLNETFSIHQLSAFPIIIAAPFLIIFATKRKIRKIKTKAVFLILGFVIVDVLTNIIFVKYSLTITNSAMPEITKLIIATLFLLLGKGTGNLIISFSRPKLIKRFRYVIKRSRKRVFLPIFSCIAVSIIAQFSYLGVLTLAPSVALASALTDSLLPVVVLLMGIGLSIIWPNFGREKIEKKSILIHSLATTLVVIGIIILQF